MCTRKIRNLKETVLQSIITLYDLYWENETYKLKRSIVSASQDGVGHAKKFRVAFGLPFLLIELFYIGFHVVRTDAPAGEWTYGHVTTSSRSRLKNRELKVMLLTGRFATTIINATQRCNVGTMLWPIETMLQRCVALEVVVANRHLYEGRIKTSDNEFFFLFLNLIAAGG